MKIALLCVLGLLVLALFVGGLVFLILFIARQLGGTVGGWRRLAQIYPSPTPPPAPIAQRETVQIGPTVFKHCTSLGVADEGLYITIWRKTALIPWTEFKAIEQTRLYWQAVPKLTIGAPPVATLVVPGEIFERMRSRLAQTQPTQLPPT